jgi:hypothetical protein
MPGIHSFPETDTRPSALPFARSALACSVVNIALADTGLPFASNMSGGNISESEYSSPQSLYSATLSEEQRSEQSVGVLFWALPHWSAQLVQ